MDVKRLEALRAPLLFNCGCLYGRIHWMLVCVLNVYSNCELNLELVIFVSKEIIKIFL